jgi:hypothetical protein
MRVIHSRAKHHQLVTSHLHRPEKSDSIALSQRSSLQNGSIRTRSYQRNKTPEVVQHFKDEVVRIFVL